MFEKDEDYRKAKSECKAKTTKVIKVWSGREEAIHDASFKDGANFGYNKCKNELVVKTKEVAKEVIEYLLTSLKIEGCDLSESGCETKDYEIYRKAISLIEDKESE